MGRRCFYYVGNPSALSCLLSQPRPQRRWEPLHQSVRQQARRSWKAAQQLHGGDLAPLGWGAGLQRRLHRLLHTGGVPSPCAALWLVQQGQRHDGCPIFCLAENPERGHCGKPLQRIHCQFTGVKPREGVEEVLRLAPLGPPTHPVLSPPVPLGRKICEGKMELIFPPFPISGDPGAILYALTVGCCFFLPSILPNISCQ